jgi:hypothetical protein
MIRIVAKTKAGRKYTVEREYDDGLIVRYASLECTHKNMRRKNNEN